MRCPSARVLRPIQAIDPSLHQQMMCSSVASRLHFTPASAEMTVESPATTHCCRSMFQRPPSVVVANRRPSPLQTIETYVTSLVGVCTARKSNSNSCSCPALAVTSLQMYKMPPPENASWYGFTGLKPHCFTSPGAVPAAMGVSRSLAQSQTATLKSGSDDTVTSDWPSAAKHMQSMSIKPAPGSSSSRTMFPSWSCENRETRA
mmetsp:Transcript_44929/g.72310  ORF Transcript_44929/g.72310 Transcript_44929/m.72310 type:complete len:204 (+) Transcript_44929:549-1160(+)